MVEDMGSFDTQQHETNASEHDEMHVDDVAAPQRAPAAPAPARQANAARRQAAREAAPSRVDRSGSGLVIAAVVSAVGISFAVGARLLRRRRRRGPQRAAVAPERLFLAALDLRQPSVELPSSAAAALAGSTFVVSDRWARSSSHRLAAATPSATPARMAAAQHPGSR